MYLPNAEHAIVPISKLKEYMLSEHHPIGRFKAKVFQSWGFKESNLEVLEKGLLTIAQSQHVTEETTSPYGIKYVIDGTLHNPNGQPRRVRTIWILDHGQTQPRFITAYPK